MILPAQATRIQTGHFVRFPASTETKGSLLLSQNPTTEPYRSPFQPFTQHIILRLNFNFARGFPAKILRLFVIYVGTACTQVLLRNEAHTTYFLGHENIFQQK